MAVRFIKHCLLLFAFYFVLFATCRALFLLYFLEQVTEKGTSAFFLSFIKAWPLDASTASYLGFIPVLLFLAYAIWQKLFLLQTVKYYLLFTTILIIGLSVAEIAVYRELKVKIYFGLLLHLQHFEELFYSVSTSLIAVFLLVVAGLSYLFYSLLNTLFRISEIKNTPSTVRAYAVLCLSFCLIIAAMIIGCRGGLQPIPINEGQVYFTQNQYVNDATVNPIWNVTHSYIENKKMFKGNGYKVLPDAEARKLVQQLYAVEKDTTISVLKIKRPNICFLILESWSADLVASTGGYKGLTPNFEKLVSEGYLFTQVQSSGSVSDQGIPAILSGYPALPMGSVINQTEKNASLPCISKSLQTIGYNSSFLFGGQLIYGNIKSYIYYNQFNKVIEQSDLPNTIVSGRLGIHDSTMLAIWRDTISQLKEPFFSCLFTLSTHSPFDAINTNLVPWKTTENPYLSSVMYADKQIGLFFEAAKKTAWYNNTIFVLVSDHSHTTPQNHVFASPAFYHIPLLITGGALREQFRGIKDNRIASQTDIATTILAQLEVDNKAYNWSKNLFNPYTQQFAFYTFNEGFGYVDTSGYALWNKKYAPKTEWKNQSQQQQKGSATLQTLMNDFLGL